MRITATASSTLETTRIPPQLDTLDAMLQVRAYTSLCVTKTSRLRGSCLTQHTNQTHQASALTEAEEAFGINEAAGHTMDELLAAIPASQQELQAALCARNALLLGGRWRVVSDACLDSLLKVGWFFVDVVDVSVVFVDTLRSLW